MEEKEVAGQGAGPRQDFKGGFKLSPLLLDHISPVNSRHYHVLPQGVLTRAVSSHPFSNIHTRGGSLGSGKWASLADPIQ